MSVYLAGKRLRLLPAMAVGKGGEADVYDIGGGQVLKLFKGPGHPDLSHSPIEQAAAASRLATHQRKLREFPAGLPERVVVPEALATDRKRNGAVVGYAMRFVTGGELLYRLAEPRMRRHRVTGNQVASLLCDLRATVAALHRRAVVIGDFNDLNVLVCGERAYLIDADSFQFGSYLCTVFSERFVDPLLCDGQAEAPILGQPHTCDSDWYAFSIMALRSLLCVGPYGGVYRPADPRKRIAHSARPLHRITIFDGEVVYPKPALHFSLLPDELLHYLHEIFAEDRRGAFPAGLLADLRWTSCSTCGNEHARLLCPRCSGGRAAARAVVMVRGQARAEAIFSTRGHIVDSRLVDDELRWLYREAGRIHDQSGHPLASVDDHRSGWRVRCTRAGAALCGPGRVELVDGRSPVENLAVDGCAGEVGFASNSRHRYWLAGGRLFRDGRWGAEAIGEVLTGQTRFWVGERFGLGFYRAGALAVTFLFSADKPGLDDSLIVPALRGVLVDAHCVFSGDRAWLFTLEKVGGRLVARATLIGGDGRIIAAAEDDDESSWLFASRTGAAIGKLLFVATDAGIVRVEADGADLVVTRAFPDTEPFVDSACRLHVGARGLYVVTGDRVLRLTLSQQGATP